MLSNKSKNKVIGNLGEEKACQYLVKKAYKILFRNFTCKLGEIDIIALNKNTIVFVEVKTRKDAEFGRPSEAVNFYKQRKIKNVAMVYLKLKGKMESHIRFDVIEVLNDKINHIENAF